MEVSNRCPECGQRLKTNYCDICMRKVPFGGVKREKRREPWEMKDGSSAHRREKGHECISFEKEEKKPSRSLVPKTSVSNPKKVLQVLASIMAIISVLSAVFSIVEDFSGTESIAVPEPAANIYDGFVAAGDPGAEDVPKVTPGEIYNENGVRVTVDDAGLSYGDYAIFMTIHNQTDHEISVNADLLSVNSCMLPLGFYQDVKAGKSEQTYLTFYDYELEKAGIKQVGNVEFVLDIYDESSYESTRKLVAIQTEQAGKISAPEPIFGIPLYNDENLTVILQDISLDGYGDCELNLHMQNHSQRTVSVYSDVVRVNGEEASGFIWNMLRPNTYAIDSGHIYELDEGENLDIQSLEEMDEITIDLYVDIMDDLEIVETISSSITFEPGAIQ